MNFSINHSEQIHVSQLVIYYESPACYSEFLILRRIFGVPWDLSKLPLSSVGITYLSLNFANGIFVNLLCSIQVNK